MFTYPVGLYLFYVMISCIDI